MGSYGVMPEPVDIPAGFVLAGFWCTADGSECQVPLSEMRPCDDHGTLLGPNHHGSWMPVFVREGELLKVQPETKSDAIKLVAEIQDWSHRAQEGTDQQRAALRSALLALQRQLYALHEPGTPLDEDDDT